MSDQYIGIDLGGTTIKLGLVDEQGEIIHRHDAPTPVGEGEDAIVDRMAESVTELLNKAGLDKRDIKGIGLGIPGFWHRRSEIVIMAVNLGWKNYPVGKKLEARLQLPVEVDNDANVAALGEMWKGAGEGSTDLIMATLGTGVGGGIVVDGEVVSGVHGVGGEIGHITVNPQGVRCACGRIGCLETESSATAIKRKVQAGLEQGRDTSISAVWKERGSVSPWYVAEAAKEGDGFALEIFDQAAYYLALALGGLANSLNPGKIIIGGGVSAAGDLLLDPLKKHMVPFTLTDALNSLGIELATLGNDAGIIGAAYLVYRKGGSNERKEEN